MSILQPDVASPRIGQKQFLIGLNPGPPAEYISQDYSDYSLYTAEQHRSVWERHTHDCTQITVALSPAQVRGEWRGAHGQTERREVSGDTVWVVPPGTPHVIHFDRPAALIHLYLTESFFQTMVENVSECIEGALVPSLLVHDPLLIELARSLFSEGRDHSLSTLFTASVATLAATHLVRTYTSNGQRARSYSGGMGPSRQRKLLTYIADHLSEAITLEELARVAEISPNYLIFLFRQSVGMTPHKYIVQLRVARARDLLLQPQLTLLEIAHRCGFQDQSQFTTVFRRNVGVAPGQFRRML